MIARHQALPAGLFATEIILWRLGYGTGLSLFCTYEPQGTSGGMGASLTRQKSTGKFCSR
jgi:hypothetical protein